MPAGYELVCFPKQIGSERRTVRATRLTRPGQQSYRQILVTAGPRHFWLDCWRTVVARSCACHRSQPADLSLSALDAGNVALGRRTVLGCIALWRGCGVRWSRADCYRRKGCGDRARLLRRIQPGAGRRAGLGGVCNPTPAARLARDQAHACLHLLIGADRK